MERDGWVIGMVIEAHPDEDTAYRVILTNKKLGTQGEVRVPQDSNEHIQESTAGSFESWLRAVKQQYSRESVITNATNIPSAAPNAVSSSDGAASTAPKTDTEPETKPASIAQRLKMFGGGK